MPFNGSGTFISLSPPDFPALPFTTILAGAFNSNLSDIFTNGLTKCLTRDGQSPPTANLPMAGFKFTNLGAGSSDTDSAQLGQTISVRGQVGVVDWNTRIINGVFEAIASNLVTPASNFPPTTDLGQLTVEAQGALVTQYYITSSNLYIRQKISGTWSSWTFGTPNKNFILNSAFNVWQQASSLGSGTGSRYLADMCFDDSIGTTYIPSRSTFSLGDTGVTTNATFYKTIAVTSVANAANMCNTNFPIEFVRTLSGQQVTFSFYCFGTVSNPIAVEFAQFFGTGGSPSATVNTFGGQVTIDTNWRRYSVTVTLPSVTGKTLGTSGDALYVKIYWDAGANFNSRTGSLGQRSGTYGLCGIKLEAGAAATPYEFPQIFDEMTACYRYYVDFGGVSQVFSGNVTSASAYTAVISYPTLMRATPSITTVDTGGASNFNTTVSNSAGNASGFGQTRTATGTGLGFYGFSYTANARL